MSDEQTAAFIAKLANYQPKDKADFLEICKQALPFAHDPQRPVIAERLVGKGSLYWDEPDIKPIMDILADIEVPDEVVVPLSSTDFNAEEHRAYMAFAKVYVNYKWRKLAELLATK